MRHSRTDTARHLSPQDLEWQERIWSMIERGITVVARVIVALWSISWVVRWFMK